MGRKDYYHEKNAPTPNSIVAAASAIVVNDVGEVLMHKRTDNLLWSLPGGAMDFGENIEQTIIREVKEETGFDVIVNKLIGTYTDPDHIIQYTNGEVRQQFSLCFECKIIGGNLTVSSESHEVSFFKITDILSINAHPAQMVRINDYLLNQEKALIR
ncbi:hypothetical protein R50345_08765 [Paenibacillus sp. FSL R5-0345]|uniref:NUDIX domain-containing protein n=1 Tax=Paenibacillus sp. FSL R5-0345 TaxID=1536770 RepID=UPI0004F73D9C|nr:NUDIX domain-containing protein [Paenibacillus sp. FSL R5-0345]AIQ34694.1 hypothetical protein R50345_08765 [Paenibacillus sp. FSL R5-0345]